MIEQFRIVSSVHKQRQNSLSLSPRSCLNKHWSSYIYIVPRTPLDLLWLPLSLFKAFKGSTTKVDFSEGKKTLIICRSDKKLLLKMLKKKLDRSFFCLIITVLNWSSFKGPQILHQLFLYIIRATTTAIIIFDKNGPLLHWKAFWLNVWGGGGGGNPSPRSFSNACKMSFFNQFL